MAGNKYYKLDTSTGFPALQAAAQTSAGVGSAGEIVALNGSGKIDDTMFPSGIGTSFAKHDGGRGAQRRRLRPI